MNVDLYRALILAVALAFVGCAAAGQGSESSNDDESKDPVEQGEDGADEPLEPTVDGDDPVDDPDDPATGSDVVCSQAKPMGVVVTPGMDLIYQNNKLTATATHVKGSGCINSLDLAYEMEAGCRLTLKLKTENNQWSVVDGGFTGDSACGDGFPATQQKTWELDPASSTIGVVDQPSAVDEPAATDACLEAEKAIHVVGWARFMSGNESLVLKLSGLGIKGEVHSVGVEGGACPKAFDPCTKGFVCGEDAYGFNCGGCTGDLECIGGYCSSPSSGCSSAGTGTKTGDLIGDIAWKDKNNENMNLHQWCGDTAIWLIKTAGW